tara:strand:- start:4537 stop:4950 length:414 start_codon:yes stop_codon:yes gene_type:complete
MSFFKDLWNTAKNTVGTVMDTANNWMKGIYTAPGSKFCGPGNPLDDAYVSEHLPGASHSGRSCYQHDKDYDNFKKQKDAGKLSDQELRNLVRESDDRLINNLQNGPRDAASYLSEYGIKAKKMAEDWGLLRPDQFVT